MKSADALVLRICIATGMLLCLVTMTAQAPGVAAYVPAGVDCPLNSNRCGLYLDLSGGASVNFIPGDSFSYQPSYTQGAYRYITDEAAAMGGVSSSQVSVADFVTFGALKSQLDAGSSSSGGTYSKSGPSHTQAASSSNIGFQDRLTVLADSSLTNTLGTMVGRIQVSGAVYASPSTYPQSRSAATAQVSVPGGSYSVAAYGDRPGTGGIPQFITFELPVKFNSPDFTSLAIFLRTSVNTNLLWGPGLNHAVTANSDFFSTLEWVGIDSVRDAQGNPITGWSVTSGSGFDYGRSYAAQIAVVPAPTAIWLLGSAMLGIAGVARRRPIDHGGAQ